MTSPLIVGLTGSIGMGKSTTADMFRALDVPVHDADATVHALYADPRVVAEIERMFDGVTGDGVIDRKALGDAVLGNPEALARLEAFVHPLVHAAEQAFIETARKAGSAYVILDIPLLFETGGEARCDRIVVVTADAAIQRARVMARPGMTPERFDAIVERQVPDATKRDRADFVVDTSHGMDSARAAVRAIDQQLRALASAQGA